MLFALLCSVSFAQTGTLKGVVKDAVTNETLIGASVLVAEGKGVVTDFDGNFSIQVNPGEYLVQISFVGYKTEEIKVKIVAGKTTEVEVLLESTILQEVEVVADVAKMRETPVAFSTIGAKKIQDELANRDLPMLLNTTPGAYATQSGGGAGDARVSIRGFDQTNVAVMVDGVPVNDMENGWVYWSNWDGLSGITRSMQVQRGLGASKLAIASVGGTINVITQGIDQKMGASVKQEVTDYGLFKTSFGYNSGQLKGDWGITLAGSRKVGNNWADATYTDGWSYFFKVQKRFKHHLLSLSANGAPQSHGQRSIKLPVAVYDEKLAAKIGVNVDSAYGYAGYSATTQYTTATQRDRGLKYNPSWGYMNGDAFNESVNYFHKPQFNLSHFWTPSEKLNVSTVAYMSIGRGGGTGLKNTSVGRDTLTGLRYYQAVYDANTSPTAITAYDPTLHASSNYLRSSINNHMWVGLLSSWTYKINENFSALLGVDARYYKGTHYQTVYDLMGGDYALDATSDANRPRGGLAYASYAMKTVGDTISYYNDAYVKWGGLFGQVEYKKDKWSLFFTGTFSRTGYQRVDYYKKKDLVINDQVFNQVVGFGDVFYYNGTDYLIASSSSAVTTDGDTTFVGNKYILNAKSYNNQSPEARYATTKELFFNGYTFKTGANYNINKNNNVFANIGYLNLPPKFKYVFDNYNKEFADVENQKVFTVEVGYGLKDKKYAVNFNAYYTVWKNKPPQYTPVVQTPDGPLSYNINGLDVLHKGAEIDAIYKFSKKFEMEGLVSLGDWRAMSGSKAYVYDNNNVIVDSVDFSAKGVHEGDAAQFQLGSSARYEILSKWYVKINWTYFGKNYANFDPTTLTGANKDRESWKMPSYNLFNFFTGYSFKYKKMKLNITGSIQNLFNAVYISDAQNGIGFNAASALVYMGMGRRYNLGLTIGF